jgi:hypothetical protein
VADATEYLLWRHTLDDGEQTTLYAVRHPLRSTRVRVVHFADSHRLDVWCLANGAAEAIVGGFFVREPYRPLGEVWIDGSAAEHEPVAAPYGERRACVMGDGAGVRFGPRGALPETPAGDLLQAGPLLLADGAVVFDPDTDHEGFSAGAGQFDSDITDGRYPRAALGLTRDGRVLALACDGRADDEAGLTLAELAETMVALGALCALNLDGGGSTSLVCDGRLRNVPRERHGIALPGGRAVSTALVFAAR